jgi:hypothetical protein
VCERRSPRSTQNDRQNGRTLGENTTRLRQTLGGGLEFLEQLSDEESRQLRIMVLEAQGKQQEELHEAAMTALDNLPFFIRIPVRAMFFS